MENNNIPEIKSAFPEDVGEKNDDTRQTAVYPLFTNFIAGTTLHGVRFIIDSEIKTLRRVLWLLVVLSCAAFFGRQLYSRVIFFMSNPTTTSFEMVYSKTLPFPDVILCNHNMFKITRISTSDLAMMQILTSGSPDQNSVSKIAAYDQQSTSTSISVNGTRNYAATVHRMKDMLLECTFQGITCTAENFELILTEFGMCYTFINNNTFDVRNSGAGNGLSMLINVEQYAYGYGLEFTAGIEILFKDNKEVPLMKDYGISVQTGGRTKIGLDMTTMDELPPPWGKCSSRPLQYYTHYSKSACWLECLTDYTFEQCLCVGDYLTDQLTHCTTLRFFNCALPITNTFSQLKASENCKCSPACQELIYTPTVSFSSFSEFMAQPLASNLRAERGPALLEDIVLAKDILTLNFDQTLKSKDIDMLVSALSVPLVNYIDTVGALYQDITTMSVQLQQLKDSGIVTGNSSSLPLTAKLMTDLSAMNASFRAADPRLVMEIADTSIYNNTFEETVGRLEAMLYLYRRTKTFTTPASNSTLGSAVIFLNQHLELQQKQVADDLQNLYSHLSLTIAADQQHALSSWWQSVSVVITDSNTNVNKLYPILNNILTGYSNLNQYANETVPSLGLDAIDESFVRENLLSVDIYFKEMRYNKMRRLPSDSVTNLICDVGGTFGLCLGASIMSIYELVDFLINLTLLRYKTAPAA